MSLENCDKLLDPLRRLCKAALPVALADVKLNSAQLDQDWGGYGIIAPDLSE